MLGNISETAKWHSKQCSQRPDGLVSDMAAVLWHGNDEMPPVTDASTESASVAISACKDATAPPGIPEIGMTAAMAPENGSHAIIQTKVSLRREFINMRQA
ncbi:MAG: hypothetical protein IPP88_17280 [Betaproteobacteria bacterium]|nr:hypothetical protein [Betaproteobacteria bacterium]